MKNPKEISPSDTGIKIKFTTRGALSSLFRLVFAKTTGKFSAGILPEITKTIVVETDKEKQAYTFIVVSFMSAMRNQLQKEVNASGESEGEIYINNRLLNTELYDQLDQKEYTFNCDDASNPKALQVVGDFVKIYEEWLIKNLNYSQDKAQQFAKDFPSYFADAFIQLWASNSTEYEELTSFCDHPRLKEWALTFKREKYQKDLKQAYYQPALGEVDVALSDLYIEPNFRIFSPSDEGGKKQNPFIPSGYKGSIHDYFKNYFLASKRSEEIDKEQEKSRMLVLLGQPGHGKSSFCHRSICDLLDDPSFDALPFFVKLQNIDKQIFSNIFEAISSSLPFGIHFKEWAENSPNQNIIFFLDGLDELFMSQCLSDQDILQILESCKKLLHIHENWFFVITTRHNYIESSKIYHSDILLLSLDQFNITQQLEFISKYKVAKGIKKTNLDCLYIVTEDRANNMDAYKGPIGPVKLELDELLRLPILLQILLVSKISIETITTKSTIYKVLFEKVLERKWSKDGRLRKYQTSEKFKPKHLRGYLGYLAYRMLKSQKGYLNKSDLRNDEVTKQFVQKYLRLDPLNNLKNVLKDVLTSFYLKETRKEESRSTHDKGNEFAIEFLHKSLYEYLAAEHIWETVKVFFISKDEYGNIIRQPFLKVLKKVQDTFSHIELTGWVEYHLWGIIKEDPSCHIELSKEMSRLLPELTNHGYIYEYNRPCDNSAPIYTIDKEVINSFVGYFLILNTLNTHKVDIKSYYDKDWEQLCPEIDKIRMAEHYINKYESKLENLNQDSLNYVLLKNEKNLFLKWVENNFILKEPLSEMTFFENKSRLFLIKDNTKFFKSKRNAFLQVKKDIVRYIRLSGRGFDLSLLDLSGEFLGSKNLFPWLVSRFIGANLAGATLKSVYYFSYFHGVDFSGADLSDAKFIGCTLDGANFFGANLTSTDLTDSSLKGVNFSGAYLHKINLTNVNLNGALLIGASVDDSNWVEKLKEWNVSGADWVAKHYSVVTGKKNPSGVEHYLKLKKSKL